MKELELHELKEIEFNILKVFDVFCKENNIRYYLAYGTLLGAIRYKGFIPWDDDIDVLVPREDYERMLKLFKDSERFHLFAFEKDENYGFPFAKLCDMTTRKIESLYKSDVDLGVEIDIFPLDAFNSNYERAKKEAIKIKKDMIWIERIKYIKMWTSNPYKRVIWKILMPFVKILGSKFFVKRIINRSKKLEFDTAQFIGAKAWCIYGTSGIIPAEAFAETIEVEFEGQMFPAPAGYDTYLTCLYGDYLPEPPVEKQVSHHIFKAYRR